MKRTQLTSKGSLNRILLAAEQAWLSRDFQQCFDRLERASRLDPANARILFQLGRLYGLRYEFTSAQRCFDKAIRIAPNKTHALVKAADLCADFVHHRLSEDYFRQALRQGDTGAEAYCGLGELCERLLRLSEAEELANRALQSSGHCGRALLLRARLERQTGRLGKAEVDARTILRSPSSREIQIRAHYELGAILDRQGHYDEAMTAFCDAKALLLPDAPPLLAQQQSTRAYWKDMLSNISGEMLHDWSRSGPDLGPQRPIALLCGHARSGTTLLEQVLDSHPSVVSAEETEVFHDDAFMPLSTRLPQNSTYLNILNGADTNALRNSRTAYLATIDKYLGMPLANRFLIDKNPSVNFLIPAFLRIFPETKLLVALRDPRDVCLSCFMQVHLPLSKASVSHLTLEGTVDRYMRSMEIWLRLRPLVQSPWLQVSYEDIVDDLEATSQRVFGFLQLRWDAQTLQFNEHARSNRVRSPAYADVAKPIFKRAVGRWRNYQKYLEPYLGKLNGYVEAFGYD